MPKLRTKRQNSIMFGLAAKAGVSHDDLRDWTAEITNGRTEHTSKLYQHECNEIIDRLKKFVQPEEVSPRTVSYRRRKAGVEQIVTAEHLQKMSELWFKVEGRTPSGLESLTLRIIKIERPRTTKECNKVIEAIKSMNTRAKTFSAFKKEDKEAA